MQNKALLKPFVISIVFLSLFIIVMLLCLILSSKAFAFEVTATSTKMLNADKGITIEAKVKNPEFKGKIKGLATLDASAEGQYYISIAWNQFIDQKTSGIKQLDSNVFKSNFVSKSKYIKLSQSIEVSGDLSSVAGSSSNGNSSGSAESQSAINKSAANSGMSSPTLSLGGNTKTDLPQQQPVTMPKLESSSSACEPVYNYTNGTATMYYQDYYLKPNGEKAIKKPCHASSEVVKIEYEECEMIHEHPKKQSWKSRRAYIEPKEGRKEVNGCAIYGSYIPHKFDESKCTAKQVNGEAVIYAKRYIIVPSTNQTIYLTDCEPLSSEKIKVDLKGCPSSLYLVQNDAKIVYPAGKRYMEHNGQRVYLDSSCEVLLDFGHNFLTEHVKWENNDKNRTSKDWWHFMFDFTKLEGGFAAVIKDSDYISQTVKYKFLQTTSYTDGRCGGWTGREYREFYYQDHWQRGDSTELVTDAGSACGGR